MNTHASAEQFAVWLLGRLSPWACGQVGEVYVSLQRKDGGWTAANNPFNWLVHVYMRLLCLLEAKRLEVISTYHKQPLGMTALTRYGTQHYTSCWPNKNFQGILSSITHALSMPLASSSSQEPLNIPSHSSSACWDMQLRKQSFLIFLPLHVKEETIMTMMPLGLLHCHTSVTPIW